MATYAYDCACCGPFEAMRPIAAFAEPAPCPGCGAETPRSLAVPRVAGMDGARRIAAATNERSRHAPRRHGPGCSCCRPKSAAPAGLKHLPGRRPWMISH